MTVQNVRLIDVFVIAPYLMYLSTNKNLSDTNRVVLFGIGVGTLLYNGINYYKNI